MGVLDEMFGLAPSGQAAPQEAPSQQGSGSGWNDPVVRSALLSAGLQLMTGGWGNGVQQMGAALGAGAQGAAGTQKLIEDRGLMERERSDKLSESAANRKQSETNARIGADSRQEVAQIRSEAMLERARLIRGPQSNQEMKIYSDAMNKYMTSQPNTLGGMQKSSAQVQAEAEAYAKSVLDNARNASGVRSQGGALPDDSAGGYALPGAGGTTAPATKAPEATSKATAKPSWSQLMRNPTFQAKVQTPEGQAQILSERPDLKGYMDAYLAPTN